LADYGGGSGCAGLWLDEPGIPAKWNAAPLTVDWGREAVYRHALKPKGATFEAYLDWLRLGSWSFILRPNLFEGNLLKTQLPSR
jgi:hypothetical protein